MARFTTTLRCVGKRGRREEGGGESEEEGGRRKERAYPTAIYHAAAGTRRCHYAAQALPAGQVAVNWWRPLPSAAAVVSRPAADAAAVSNVECRCNSVPGHKEQSAVGNWQLNV